MLAAVGSRNRPCAGDFQGTDRESPYIVAPVPRAWTPLKDPKQQAVLEDLREILGKGVFNFDVGSLRVLPFLFGNGEQRATKAVVKARLLAYLMEHDPGKDPIGDSERLTETSRFRLTLFRGLEGTFHFTTNEARVKASEAIHKHMTADGMRKEGGLEYQLLVLLSEEILDSMSGTADYEPEADAPHDPLVRVFGTPLDRETAVPIASEAAPRAQDLHIELSPRELGVAFWWRDSTNLHIARLAELHRLSIYVGGDGPSDVGPPLNRDLFAAMIDSRLRLSGVTRHQREAIVKTVVAHCPEQYLGSIVRELYRSRTREVSVNAETQLYYDIQSHTAAARSRGGFVARAVVLLAFTLRHDGRTAEIISTHYDSDIESAAENRREHFRHLRSISLRDYLDHLPPNDPEPDTVPLLRISGRHGERSTQGLVVGEADFLADERLGPGGHNPEHVPRYRALVRALTRGGVLFVGTSLSDPGVLAALATTRHTRWPRYALVLPPAGLTSTSMPADQIAGALHLLALRYLHLGVVPVIADFDHQVPQLLREVALKVHMGRDYAGHADRMELWWRRWAEVLGYDRAGAPSGSSDGELVGLWQRRLRALAATIAGPEVLGQAQSAKETIRIEVWLRNHHRRCLFLWASSPAAPSEEAPTEIAVQAEDPNDIVPLAFRTGRTVHQRLLGTSWRYGVATNIVLYAAPWHRLPVGVVNVLSSREDVSLASLATDVDALRAFERGLLQRVKELLRDDDDEEDSRDADSP